LPLEMFDDADEYETHSPEEWLKLGPEEGKARTTGRSLFFIHNRFLWLPCEIVDYDAATEEYIVEFLSEDDLRGRPDLAHVVDDLLQTLGDIAIPKLTIAKDKTVVEPVWPNTDPILLPARCTKRVKRLSLWMDSEIADTFFHRLQLAQHIKQVANAQRRLHAFVGSISSDSFAVLQSKVVEGVIRRLMRSNERLVTSFQRAVEVILAEVNDNFNYAMRSAVLLYRHLDATEVRRSRSLRFPDLPTKPSRLCWVCRRCLWTVGPLRWSKRSMPPSTFAWPFHVSS